MPITMNIDANGIITRAGASYTDATTGERIGVGKDNVKAAIDADDELRGRLTALTDAALLALRTGNTPGGLSDVDADDDWPDVSFDDPAEIAS